MVDNCVLIMAGGKGTRFWPKSTENKPKQFLSLIDKKTMIQQTFERVNKHFELNHIFVVTCEKYKDLVKQQLPDLYEDNIIIEPAAKSTSACILLSALYINQIFPNANIIELPSDHIINDLNEFVNTLKLAISFLDIKANSILTLGIKPDRPETGYGYIQISKGISDLSNGSVAKVDRFVEKPSLEKAKEYLKNGNYLWNSGIFIFNSNYILQKLHENLPNTYKILSELPEHTDINYEDELKQKYIKCEEVPIEYSVMEKCDSIYVIPSDFGWDDVGTWNALQRYIKPDEFSNITKGKVKALKSWNNIVYAEDKNIVLLGIDNIFVIEANDKIVIGKKDKLSKVHELKNIIEKRET